MAGSPQPNPEKPRLLCPLTSQGPQQMPCVEHHCALWSKRDAQCAMITTNNRIEEGFERLIRMLADIKAKI
jgi:hypothetical protein